MINGRLSFLIPWLHANLRIRSIAGRMWNERVWLIVAAIVFAGCAASAASGPSLMSEQERCQQTGGAWRGTVCERGSGGGGY
jgi:hypothetical protein